MTFLDIGAHIGSVFADVRSLDRSIKIIAVEAIPDKVDAMKRRFPDVTFHCCAAGDETGEIPFFVDTKLSGYSSMSETSRGGADKVEIRVPLRRLDNLLPDAKDIDLIKLDVEGVELRALRGASEVIGRCRPVVMFESGPSTEGGLSGAEKIHEWFTQRDFDVLVPNRVAFGGPGLTCDGFTDSHRFPRRTLNYFAVPQERRAEVRDRALAILKIS